MNKNKQVFKRGFVYFEKQSDDRLCGLHSINSLLQGPFYDPISLSEIGLELNELEKNLLGQNSGYKNENVDDSGNFNIQVITEALKRQGCQIKPLKKNEFIQILNGSKPPEAFIFNSTTHWFSIRKIEDIWFNLNSTNSLPGPEIISDFYLSAFIQGSEDIGYTNFLVSNLPNLQDKNSYLYSSLLSHQTLVNYEDIVRSTQEKKDKSIERHKKKDENEVENKVQYFTGKGTVIDPNYYLNCGQGAYGQFDDDEMQQAYQLSLIEFVESKQKELPPEPKDDVAYKITIRYNDKFFYRKFNANDKIKDIKLFVQTEIPTFNSIELFEAFPRVVYDKDYQTIQESGISRNSMILAKIIQ